MRQTFLAASAAFLLASGATAAGVTLSNPPVTPDPNFKKAGLAGQWPHVSLAEARRLQAQPGVLFVDGRSFEEWRQGHIPGAVSIPTGEFDKRYAMQKKALRRAKIIVTYCHGEHCGLADTLTQYLIEKGYKNVAVFWGGYPAWLGAKMPLEKGAKPKP